MMNFLATAEVFKAAYEGMHSVRSCVEPYLNLAFSKSAIATLEINIIYCPIVMPDFLLPRYPSRSKIRKKARTYDCCPQLDYDVFVSGTFEAQLREYLRGIAESAPYLAGLGATPEQIKDFEEIMSTAVDRILAERPDQTRH